MRTARCAAASTRSSPRSLSDTSLGRVAFVALVALALLFLAGRAAVTVRDADISDFRCFYEAGRLVRTGADPYDRAIWLAAAKPDPARLPPCPDAFAYPLWTAMAIAPLTVVDIHPALAAWEIILVACAIAGALLVARTRALVGGARLILVLVLWSHPMYSAIANAQLGPVLFAALAALGHLLERARPRAAALAWAALLLKPNVVSIVILGAPFIWGPRFLRAAVLTGAVVLAASLVLIPSWPLDVTRTIFGQQLLVDADLSSFSALATTLGFPSFVGIATSLIAVALFAAALRARKPMGMERVAVLAVSSFLITPYARPHDFVALAICWAIALTGPAASPALVVLVAVLLPWSFVAGAALGVPWSLYVLVTVATAVLMARASRALRASAAPLG